MKQSGIVKRSINRLDEVIVEQSSRRPSVGSRLVSNAETLVKSELIYVD